MSGAVGREIQAGVRGGQRERVDRLAAGVDQFGEGRPAVEVEGAVPGSSVEALDGDGVPVEGEPAVQAGERHRLEGGGQLAAAQIELAQQLGLTGVPAELDAAVERTLDRRPLGQERGKARQVDRLGRELEGDRRASRPQPEGRDGEGKRAGQVQPPFRKGHLGVAEHQAVSLQAELPQRLGDRDAGQGSAHEVEAPGRARLRERTADFDVGLGGTGERRACAEKPSGELSHVRALGVQGERDRLPRARPERARARHGQRGEVQLDARDGGAPQGRARRDRQRLHREAPEAPVEHARLGRHPRLLKAAGDRRVGIDVPADGELIAQGREPDVQIQSAQRGLALEARALQDPLERLVRRQLEMPLEVQPARTPSEGQGADHRRTAGVPLRFRVTEVEAMIAQPRDRDVGTRGGFYIFKHFL